VVAKSAGGGGRRWARVAVGLGFAGLGGWWWRRCRRTARRWATSGFWRMRRAGVVGGSPTREAWSTSSAGLRDHTSRRSCADGRTAPGELAIVALGEPVRV